MAPAVPLHPWASLFTLLLAASALCKGYFPAVALLIIVMATSRPSDPQLAVTVWAAIAISSLQLVAFVTINIVSSANGGSDAEVLFGQHQTLLEGLGVYQATNSQLGVCLLTNVPNVLLLSFSIIARKRITRTPNNMPVTAFVPSKTPFEHFVFNGAPSTIVLLLLCSVGAALIAPTYLIAPYLMSALVLIGCTTLVRGRRATRYQWTRKALRIVPAFMVAYGCGWWAVATLSQNALVISWLSSSLSGTGLQPIDALSGVDHIAMRYLQAFLVLTLTMLSHRIMAGTLATDANYSEEKVDILDSMPVTANLDDGASTTGNNTRANSRLASRKAARADSHPIGTPMYRVPSILGAARSGDDSAVEITERSFVGSSRSMRQAPKIPESLKKVLAMAESVYRHIVSLLSTTGNALLHYFLYVPSLPLVCVTANIIVFPSACSLPMLAGLWWGLLCKPRHFVQAVPILSLVKGALLLTQFSVFTSGGWAPASLVSAFFFTASYWMRVLEMGSNTLIFVVMCASSWQHVGDQPTVSVPLSTTHRHSHIAAISNGRKLRIINVLTPVRVQQILSQIALTRRQPSTLPARESLNGDENQPTAPLLKEEHNWMLADEQLDLADAFEALVGRSPYVQELTQLTRGFAMAATARQSTGHPSAAVAAELAAALEGERPRVRRWEIIMAFYDHSKLSSWSQFASLVRFTAVQSAIPISLITVFVMSTFVSSLDVFHAVLLLQFLLFICFTRFAAKHWYLVVLSTFSLTTFYVIYTFATRFFDLPEYAANGIKYSTIGIAPFRTQWHAIPCFIAAFAVAAVLSLSREEIATSGQMISAFDWGRLKRRALVVIWQRRATMAVVTIVFASLAIIKDNSLLNEGLLAVLLIISTFYVTPRVPAAVQRWVWIVAVIYSAVVVVLVSALQFTDIQKRVHDIFSGYSECTDNLRCEQDIGVLSGDAYVLTQFLAPWCVALVASFVHLTSTVADQDTANATSVNFVSDETKKGLDAAAEPSTSFATPDQRAVHGMYQALKLWDSAAAWVSNICGECASVFVWVALYYAAATDGNLANLVYAIFLILNLRNAVVLFYCIAHILIIYSYGFVFVPKLTAAAGSSTLARVTGIETKLASHYAIVAPMFVFYAVLLRQCTKDTTKDVKFRLPPIESLTKWSQFIRYAFFDTLGYEMFVFASLGTFVYSSRYISGLMSAMVIAITVYQGRYRFLSNRLARAAPFFLTVCVFFYQMATILNSQHGLWDGSFFGEWKDYIHLTSIDQIHVGAFFGIVSMHLANDWQLLSVKRYDRLVQTVRHPTLVSCLQAQKVKSLTDLSANEFEAAVPVTAEDRSETCLAKVNQFIINVFFLVSPFAITSFVAGVSSPSILNLTLIVLGLAQLLLRREIFWEFTWSWPRVYVPYFIILMAFPLIASPTVVANWIASNPTLTDVLGLSYNGSVLRLSWGQAVALFTAVLQTRVFEEFGYEVILRRMQYQYRIEGAKHKRLIQRFKNLNAEELAEAEHMQNDLWERLQKIRDLTSRGVVVANTESQDETSTETSIPIPSENKSVRDAPADAEFGAKKERKERAARELVIAMAMVDNSEQTRRNHIVGIEASRRDRIAAKESKEFSVRDGDGPLGVRNGNASDTESHWEDYSNINTPRGQEVGTEGVRDAKHIANDEAEEKDEHVTELSFKDRTKEAINRLALEAMLRMYSVSLVGIEDPSMADRPLWIRFLSSVLAFVERYLGDFVILFAFGNFLSSSSLWDAVPCFVLLIFAVPWYPFPPAAVFDFVAIFLLVGVLIKSSIPLVTAHVTLSGGLSVFLSTLFVKVPRGDDGSSIPTDISTLDVALDFLVFALILALQAICSHNGTHPPRKRIGQASKKQKPSKDPLGSRSTTMTNTDDVRAPLLDTARASAVIDVTSDASEEDEALEEEQEDHQAFFIAYFTNIFSPNGVGMDLYSLMFIIDLASILVFTFTYYYIQGSESGSIITSVQNNLLPGPFVLVLFIIILLMIADRVCYITRSLRAKWLLTVTMTLCVMIGYVCWVQSVEPTQQSLGLAFFLVKLLYLFVSCIQLRKGYAIERRHDPFTHDHEGILLWVGYQAYRAVPFLWELRVTIDWSCETTALRFPWYLVVEDMYDIIYNRYVAIVDTEEQQAVFGAPITRGRKVLDGVTRIGIMIFVIVFPLFYYSSFNPASVTNGVTSAVVTVGFDQSSTIFESSIVSIEPYPGNLGRWLQNTRPGLRPFDTADPQKSSQLVNLGSCSNDLWGVSPQGLRRMNESLLAAMANQSSVTLSLQLELQRLASTGDTTGNAQLLVSTYEMPYVSAKLMYAALNASPENGTVITVELPNFYRPIILNQPSSAVDFSAADGDNVDCTMQLRTEFDANIQTMVRYWCLKCNSLFSYSNFPNSSFPEWLCLTQGIGCDRFNFEVKSTVYSPTSMYFAVISDRIPETIAFLPNIGIIALYTTFVLAIGRVFRSLVSGSAQQAMYQYMADPEPVDKLVRYIYVARAFGDLVLEESLFFELIDLLRSPETLLTITKPFPKHFRDKASDGSVTPKPTPIIK